jgi:diaminohydroxyphosphoribosylaminopyrimidine deaminase / 5-amino-6-(5-phosphoribosylamino)uracil reductase
MAAALDMARRGIGFTSPNPPVGAVIVRDEQIIGQGYHRKAGEPHAEVEALRDAMQRNPKAIAGATLYVTLEPCCTTGRTPPCTEAIRAARIGRVVYGCQDPNPAHAGRADAVLHEARIALTAGVEEQACKEIIRPFAKWINTGLPYVIAKAGQSLDGRITRPAGESQWITSDAARAHSRRIRQRVDAIIIGAETLRRDNPRLTLRDADVGQGKLQPYRVVMTRSGDLPQDCHLFTDEHRDRTMILKGFEFDEVLVELGQRGVLSVLVEGGGLILGSAFASRQVDEVIWYIAPRICGGGRPSVSGIPLLESVELEQVKVLPLGDNVCVSGYPVWP